MDLKLGYIFDQTWNSCGLAQKVNKKAMGRVNFRGVRDWKRVMCAHGGTPCCHLVVSFFVAEVD